MRSITQRAAAVVAVFSGLKESDQIRMLGKEAAELNEAEAARIHRRLTRGSGARGLSLASIVHYSASKRRARQTHPGKRRKRVKL